MKQDTSWQRVGGWYKKISGDKGHYYQREIVIPGVLRLLDLKEGESLLDLGCGTGVLGRAIPKGVNYLGVDSAANLIDEARRLEQDPKHKYIVGDATRDLKIESIDKGVIMLALQNMENAAGAIGNLAKTKQSVIVLNHPAFRVPRQSEWGVDLKNKIQYRRINRYMSSLRVPMAAEPSKGEKSAVTWSFHWPISMISDWIRKSGMVIENVEEWTSNKKSTGSMAKIEDRAREEFPLFLTLLLHNSRKS